MKCSACHTSTAANAGAAKFVRIRFGASDCAVCHADSHGGQLPGTPCAECHSDAGWTTVSYARHPGTPLPLDGAHRALSCASCHGPTRPGLPPMTTTRPLGHAGVLFRISRGTLLGVSRQSAPGAARPQCRLGRRLRVLSQPRGLPAKHDRRGGAPALRLCTGRGAPRGSVRRMSHRNERTRDHEQRRQHARCRAASAAHGAVAWREGNDVRGLPPEPARDAVRRSTRRRPLRRVSRRERFRAGTEVQPRARRELRAGRRPRQRGRAPSATRARPSTVTRRSSIDRCRTAARTATRPSAPRRAAVSGARQVIRAILGLVPLAVVPRAARAQGTANPHEATIGPCATCHLPEGWRPVRISKEFHHAEKVFPLDGAHASANCTSCHTSLDFSKASPQCASCHRDVHRGELGINCARCHTTRTFVDQARLVRMHEETRFPLRGMHAAAACESCHPGTASGQPQYTGRPTTCVGCHRQDFDRATSPPHAGFPTLCSTCHTETGWKGAPFDHNTTAFPLTGSHQATPCASCHADGVSRGSRPIACRATSPISTHTSNPPHAAAAFATTCATCHTTSTWQGAVFDHDVYVGVSFSFAVLLAYVKWNRWTGIILLALRRGSSETLDPPALPPGDNGHAVPAGFGP